MPNIHPTKEKIHQAALKLFVEKGVAETTIRDLALNANIAEGTLYRHYTSKDELVAGLFTSNYKAFAQRLILIRENQPDFQNKLQAIINEVCGFYDENPMLFRFLLLIQHQGLPRVPDNDENPVYILRNIIEKAAQEGDINTSNPTLTTAMLLGLLLQTATFLVYGQLSPPMLAFRDEITAAVWRLLNK